MPVDASPARPPAAPSRFHTLDIGEPIAVRLARFESVGDLRAVLKELPPRPALVVLLLVHLPGRVGREELLGLLDQATARATRVVLAGGQDNAVVAAKLRQVAGQRQWPCQLQWEPDPERAVVGAMQSLQAGNTFALLWPDEPGVSDPSALVAQGARWRAAWEAPEEGDYHWLPPAADAPTPQ